MMPSGPALRSVSAETYQMLRICCSLPIGLAPGFVLARRVAISQLASERFTTAQFRPNGPAWYDLVPQGLLCPRVACQERECMACISAFSSYSRLRPIEAAEVGQFGPERAETHSVIATMRAEGLGERP